MAGRGLRAGRHPLWLRRTCERIGIVEAGSEQVYDESDVIGLHCPMFEENRGMINKAVIDRMKPCVMLINAARGPLVVEQDLADALKEGKVSGVAVDVLSSEPPKPDNPLLSAPNCIVSPHVA